MLSIHVGLIPNPLVGEEANLGATPNALERWAPTPTLQTSHNPSVLVLTPMAQEEAPGTIPGTSQKEDPPTPIRTGPEIGEGALLLGMIVAGGATVLFVIQSGFVPVVAIPMTGEGDKPCDRGFKGEKLGSYF